MVRRMILNKRGSSHFEMVISFVLFAGFSFFLILALKPTQKNLLEESIVLGLKDKFFEMASVNFTSVLVNSTESNCAPCYPTEVKNLQSNYSSYQPGNNPCLFYIRVSPEFVENDSITECNENNYSIGYIDNQMYVSNKTLHDMNRRYNESYEEFKTNLSVPMVADFAVIVSGVDAPKMDKVVPDDAQVVSKIFRKKILYSNGSAISHDFIIKVW